jgi:glycosyltransferase involved in cell wall biosynthesis
VVLENGDRDGIPNVLFEAMVSGVPVVSTDIEGVCELIEHRKNGLIVEQRDASALANAMQLLITTPGLRNELARSGRQTVLTRFTREASAKHVYEILAPMLDSAESMRFAGKQGGLAVSEYGEQ